MTVPLASGGETVKMVPAQEVPARPVAVGPTGSVVTTPGGSMSKMGSAGKGRGSARMQPAAVAAAQDGLRRMLLIWTVWVLIGAPWEVLMMARAAFHSAGQR